MGFRDDSKVIQIKIIFKFVLDRKKQAGKETDKNWTIQKRQVAGRKKTDYKIGQFKKTGYRPGKKNLGKKRQFGKKEFRKKRQFRKKRTIQKDS